MQHPEFETYMGMGSVHASQFSCADCHMEKATNADGQTYTSHYWVSPLASDSIKASCWTMPAAQMQKLTAYLKRNHYRCTEYDGRKVYARHFIGFYISFLTHLSFLLILAVSALALITAQVSDQTVMPGQTLALDGGASITVEAFQIEDETGTLDYASEVMHLTESCFLTLNGVDGLFFQALYPGYIRAEDELTIGDVKFTFVGVNKLLPGLHSYAV